MMKKPRHTEDFKGIRVIPGKPIQVLQAKEAILAILIMAIPAILA